MNIFFLGDDIVVLCGWHDIVFKLKMGDGSKTKQKIFFSNKKSDWIIK